MTQFGLMQDAPLMISSFIRYASDYHGAREVVSRTLDGAIHRYSYGDAHRRACQAAHALTRLGVKPGDRVGTLAWNTYRHFELFYAVSGMGAILHTVNPRLFDEQIHYIINHAQDSYLFVDLSFVPLVEKLIGDLPSVKGVILLADEAEMPQTTLDGAISYESLIAPESERYDWPEFDERTASSLCYTSGTTGNPKGVLYSHRSTVIHALGAAQNAAFGLSAFDAVMPISPMYHANAWSLPYVSPMVGAKLVLPGADMSGPALHELIDGEGVTFGCGVPTVWTLVIQHMKENGLSADSLKNVVIGGSAVPESMIDTLRDDYGVMVRQVWGMTETSPLGTMTTPTPAIAALEPAERTAILAKQGRVQYGCELKILDDEGRPVPRDGVAFGAMWVKGPWVASGYYKMDNADVLDEDGWFPTGDVATLDQYGFMKITDRTKDVIKSGGEWISSIDIENIATGHPKVHMAAVVGVYHPKWEERPILIIVPNGEPPGKQEMLDYLEGKIAKWWMPDDVLFVEELPMTATGKIQKLTLRQTWRDHLAKAPGAT
jgi:fatty-acyl-CoA synthase